MPLRSILIADDEESIRHVLSVMLAERGFAARAVKDGEEALRELSSREYDALVTDVRMPKMDGLALVRAALQIAPELTIIVMSAYGSHELAIEAMKAGAYDYLGKPFRPDDVLLVLRKAEERERLRAENRLLKRQMGEERGFELVAESPAMKEIARLAGKLAAAPTTVLITGERGTGKEVVARAIHAASPRAERPFIAVNCGGMPAALIESELFGHVKGAFTDAQKSKRGLFEEADGGTLLLDEIGDLPIQLQGTLLRVLQEGEVRRVGDTRSVKIDVRVIAATNRDLVAAMAGGTFREDLFDRLNVVPLHLPPLRERPEEIEPLAQRFLARHAARLGVARKRLAPEALQLLRAYRWPGNVRELENALERALVLSEDEEIEPHALPEALQHPAPAGPPQTPAEGDLSVKRAQRALEAELIRKALQRTGGNRTKAAELLELSPRALLYKIRDYGIE